MDSVSYLNDQPSALLALGAFSPLHRKIASNLMYIMNFCIEHSFQKGGGQEWVFNQTATLPHKNLAKNYF